MRQLSQLRRNIFAVPIVGGPIVDAMEVHASCKNIGVARQAHGGEESAVAAAPQAHARGIDIAAALQILSGGHDVLVFGGSAASAPGSLANRAAIPGPAATVDSHPNIHRGA